MTLLALSGAFFLLLMLLVRGHFTETKLSHMSWEELLAELQPVQSAGINSAALEYLQPVRPQIATEPSELWKMIGGAEGLGRMRSNADVLLALAAYAQQWNFDESVIVAERMRRDSLALRRAARVVACTVFLGVGRSRGAFYMHEAASAYYLMARRLLALYEASPARRHPRLAAAL